MIHTEGTAFDTLNGSGTVVIIDGDPWVQWEVEGELFKSLHRCRVRTSKSALSGHRWECYIPGDGGHNRTQHVPTKCVEAAYEQINEQEV